MRLPRGCGGARPRATRRTWTRRAPTLRSAPACNLMKGDRSQRLYLFVVDVTVQISSFSGRDCVKSLRSSYTGLYPDLTTARLLQRPRLCPRGSPSRGRGRSRGASRATAYPAPPRAWRCRSASTRAPGVGLRCESLSGDTAPCRMAGVTLHGFASPESGGASSALNVQAVGFRVSGFGLQVSSFRFRVSVSGSTFFLRGVDCDESASMYTPPSPKGGYLVGFP